MSSERSSEHETPATGEDFRRACGRFATGVTVVTVCDASGAPHGLTVSSFTSVSLDPPLVLICVGASSTVLEHIRHSKYFGINVLEESQRRLSDRFSRKVEDRFGGVEWATGKTGVPLLSGVVATLECATRRRITLGDHDVFIGEVLHTHVSHGTPLVYFSSRYHTLA